MALEVYLSHLLLALNDFVDADTGVCFVDELFLMNKNKYIKEIERPRFRDNIKKLETLGLIEIIDNQAPLYSILITPRGEEAVLVESAGGKSPFDSESERSLYVLLKALCGSEFEIQMKIRLKDLLKNINTVQKEYQPFVEKSHLDFVIYDNELRYPILVIEYDGFHDENQKKRDFIKDKICNANNIPIIRLSNFDDINEKTLFRRILLSR